MKHTIAILWYMAYAITCAAYDQPSFDRPPHGSLEAHISMTSNVVIIGQSFAVRVTLTNSSEEDLVIRPICNLWEWLHITDTNDAPVPKTTARIINPGQDGPESFLVIRSGDSISEEIVRNWVTDSKQLDITHLKAALPEGVLLDQVTDYNIIEPGRYKLWFTRSSVDGGILIVDGIRRDIEEYYAAERFNGSVTSNVLEIEFKNEP